MFDSKMLEELKQQEQKLQFYSFDLNDVYVLGTMLREADVLLLNVNYLRRLRTGKKMKTIYFLCWWISYCCERKILWCGYCFGTPSFGRSSKFS